MQRNLTSFEGYLLDYHTHREREWRWKGIDMLLGRIVIDSVLKSDTLSPGDRQIASFRYFAQLDQLECAQVLGITQQAVSDRVGKFLNAIDSALKGEYQHRSQTVRKSHYVCVDPAIDKWMIDVVHNVGEWWNVPDDVRQYILRRFGAKGGSVQQDDYERNKGRYILRARSWMGRDTTFENRRIILVANEEPDIDDDTDGILREHPRWNGKIRMPHDKYIQTDGASQWADI